MLAYPVVETFYSFQGEGLYAGCAAYFVRLFGCPVKCPWCDTKNSWLESEASAPMRLDAEQIACAASRSSCEFAVITGGEPALHDLRELVDAFKKCEIPVHLETSGFLPKDDGVNFDWIAVSPKLHASAHESYLLEADEFKFIVSAPSEIGVYLERFGKYLKRAKAVWLTPEYSVSKSPEVLAAISEAVALYGAPLRAGFQLHKLYSAR